MATSPSTNNVQTVHHDAFSFILRTSTRPTWLTLSLKLPICPAVPTCVRHKMATTTFHAHLLASAGARSLSLHGPDTWNSLPLVIRCIVVPSTFKRRLKAELISRAYDVSLDISDDYTASLMLNTSGFASSVVRFYFAFTVFLLYALPPIFLHC